MSGNTLHAFALWLTLPLGLQQVAPAPGSPEITASPDPAAEVADPGPADEVADPEPGDAPDDAPTDDADAPDEGPADEEAFEDELPAEPAAEDPPASEPPAPRRYVWGGTEIEATASGESGAASPPAGESEAPLGPTVGGYYGPTDTKEVAPKDGQQKLIIAYILLPLGTLATVSGAASVWLTDPSHCPERLGRFGGDVNPKQCRGLQIWNIVRTTYGSLMVASGAVLLGLGLHERKRYREWRRQHGAFVQPWIGRGAGGFVLGGRF